MISFAPSWCEQGPTISPVYCSLDGNVAVDYYAINIVVPQKSLYKSIQQLRSVSYFTSCFSMETFFFYSMEIFTSYQFPVGNYLFIGQQFSVVFEADSYSQLSKLPI